MRKMIDKTIKNKYNWINIFTIEIKATAIPLTL